jgi:hypothetical protein
MDDPMCQTVRYSLGTYPLTLTTAVKGHGIANMYMQNVHYTRGMILTPWCCWPSPVSPAPRWATRTSCIQSLQS